MGFSFRLGLPNLLRVSPNEERRADVEAVVGEAPELLLYLFVQKAGFGFLLEHLLLLDLLVEDGLEHFAVGLLVPRVRLLEPLHAPQMVLDQPLVLLVPYFLVHELHQRAAAVTFYFYFLRSSATIFAFSSFSFLLPRIFFGYKGRANTLSLDFAPFTFALSFFLVLRDLEGASVKTKKAYFD